MTSTQIDHIVLLVSIPFFENPPAWLTTNFTITPGGHHNGQASRNKLIIFADGTYLELFNWYDKPPLLDDENLPMRFWGPKQEGLIDFALTSTTVPAEECIDAVNKILTQGPDKDAGLGVKYQNPIAGSRKRADGVEVKWKVTRPVFHDGEKTPNHNLFPGGRLDAPFSCHDVTQRTFRVASDDKAKATHPCGATGIMNQYFHSCVPTAVISLLRLLRRESPSAHLRLIDSPEEPEHPKPGEFTIWSRVFLLAFSQGQGNHT